MASQPTLTAYIVECFWPGVRDEQVRQGAERVRTAAAELTRDGPPISFTGSVIIPRDEVVFYLFEGPSLDAVRTACERAGLPFERIVESLWNPVPTTKEETS
jgi:hypothetical protein